MSAPTAPVDFKRPPRAKKKVEPARALYKQQKYAEAKAAFEHAFWQKPAHDIAANLGYAELKLRLWREAAEHLAPEHRTGGDGTKRAGF